MSYEQTIHLFAKNRGDSQRAQCADGRKSPEDAFLPGKLSSRQPSSGTSAPLELTVSALSHDGRGIAFRPDQGQGRGKAVFIPGALPIQKILCEARADHGSWQVGRLLEILDPGDNTAPPLCPHAAECGGCPLQTMPYTSQLHWKSRIVLDAMERIGHFTRSALETVWGGVEASPAITSFRNKIELSFGHDSSGRPFPGMRKRQSHEVIPVSQCALVDSDANMIVRQFRETLDNWTWPRNFWRFLVLRRDYGPALTKRWRLLTISRPPTKAEYRQIQSLGSKLLAKNRNLFAFIAESRRDPAMLAKGEKRILSLAQQVSPEQDPSLLSLALAGRTFSADVASFFQVNDGASEKLATLVREADSQCDARSALLDLYCGVGVPGLLIAPDYERSLGLELDGRAISQARANARDLPQCSFQAGDVSRLLRKLPMKFARKLSTVLMDPPRSGVERSALSGIIALAPKNIIMVSCNPATMARDASFLHRHYELKSLKSVDLFPHTPHVESCSLWSRR